MDELTKFLPLIPVILIPGLLNLFVAFNQLAKDCQSLPFFKPHKTPGVWLWVIFQIMLPCLFFFLMFSQSLNSKIDTDLYGKAVSFGFGFVAFMNSTIDTGLIAPIDIKTFYTTLVRLAYNLIASKENARTAIFWSNFRTTLINSQKDLNDGLNFLESYFTKDISLSKQEKEDSVNRLKNIRTMNDRNIQVGAIEALMNVRRKDLPYVLKAFGFDDGFMDQYSQEENRLKKKVIKP